MLRDLLEYARIGQEKDDASPLDLRELLNQILDEKRQEMEAVQAEVIVSDALPPLRMSETRAYQVFMNLLTNSLKFRREGVAPRIEIGVAEEADKNSSHRVFFFRDNGKGIGDRDIGKVFNLFTSFGGFDQGGTGAGLAIVKRIVDLRGGTIRVESRTEEGTTFIFSLPVAHPLD
ncbi:MAG: hypothetical protein JSV00_07800 [bacterium]|nr:MAG: hypothetical protein JSV00_07800 [bacterium]